MFDTAAKDLQAYVSNTAEAANKSDFDILAEIVRELIACRVRGATVYTAGNGGSAATASHMANDLIKGCRAHGREGIKTVCLCDCNAVLTCLANDFCYEDALAIALRTLAGKDDLLVVYSGSGNSENLVRCVGAAKDIGMKVIGFLGRDGGKLKSLCDISAVAKSDIMETIEDIHMIWEHGIATQIRNTLGRMWGAEIFSHPKSRPTAALFDFDGTVSLIREGWQEVMVPYFIEVLCETPDCKKAAADGKGEEMLTRISVLVRDFVDYLTGKQTIFQCERLDEEVVRHGGEHVDPLLYKKEYLRRLMQRIADRHAGLRDGTVRPEQMIVAGFVDFAKMLRSQGIKLYLASGTDEADVLREAGMLGVTELFDGGIYGAKDEIKDCSKELVIKKILAENNITGKDLISFGDGYVEIELIANIGGYAVGVATDEAFLIGKATGKACGASVNEWKRNRLIAGKACAIIPDFDGDMGVFL